MQSFIVAVNSLSAEYRISQLPSQANTISKTVVNDDHNAGTWPERFGFEIKSVSIENIEFTPQSREPVQQYSSNRMNVAAYEGVSQQAANKAAQQRIAQGIQNNGLGDGGGLLFGMNMTQGMNSSGQMNAPSMSLEEQIEIVKKLKGLLDAGILSQEEFDTKKREIMGL